MENVNAVVIIIVKKMFFKKYKLTQLNLNHV